jgi:hypothetical protein
MVINMHATTTSPQHMDDHLKPHQPAQLPVGITEYSFIYGDLEGNPPRIFDGDRSKTEWFITQFRLFCMINDGNPIITNPKRRVALALTYIRGPKVEAWVTQQCDALSMKANHARTHADVDEALWEDFIAEFKRAFAETSYEVRSKLDKLQMAGDDIEMYIATFDNLMRRAGYERESGSMVGKFCQGLPTNLEQSITKRQAIPDTIDEWQSAARKEVKLSFMRRYFLEGREGEDTDAAHCQTGVIRLSGEAKERHMAEGRCFECSEKGHRARDCPNKY